MTVYELKRRYQEANPEGHFFDKETLRFFGENLSGMKITGRGYVTDYLANAHECYELTGYSPLLGRKTVHYFDTTTFQLVYSVDEN